MVSFTKFASASAMIAGALAYSNATMATLVVTETTGTTTEMETDIVTISSCTGSNAAECPYNHHNTTVAPTPAPTTVAAVETTVAAVETPVTLYVTVTTTLPCEVSSSSAPATTTVVVEEGTSIAVVPVASTSANATNMTVASVPTTVAAANSGNGLTVAGGIVAAAVAALLF